MQINLVLADDEELFRVGLSYILSRDSDINIVHEAGNGKELLEYLASCESLPDIIIIDIKMPELNGVEATKTIHKAYPEISIIALTTYNTKPFIRNMIDVGACAYLVKNSPTNKVLHTIKQVYYNGFYYDNEVLKAIKSVGNAGNKNELKTVFDDEFITPREKEILELICQQLTSQEIAERLFISKRTVEVHRKNLLEKARVKNIAGLVIFAIQNELVTANFME
jgi:DNA-binding NarL/FixJ family response regulator